MPLAVVDCRIPTSAEQKLHAYGYTVLPLPLHPKLPKPIASHPDLLLFFAPNAIYTTPLYATVAENELEQISRIADRPIRTTLQELGEAYPHDILLDAVLVGEHLFCLHTHTARELTSYPAYQVQSVRQGYAKCSTLPLNPHALITADPSIAKAASAKGIDVLTVCNGGICLPGYDTGFIGGAASHSPYKDRTEIFFCGNPLLHPSGTEITEFCKKHGKTAVSLGEFPLTDIGTLFLLP